MKGREIGWRHAALSMLTAAALALACGEDRPVTSPEEAIPTGASPGHSLAVSVTCTADVRGPSLSCSGPNTAGSLRGPQFLIVGGQGVFVELANTTPVIQGQKFKFDVTVKNLIPQALGTPDGTTNTGVSVFFHTEPHATSPATGDLEIRVDNALTGTFINSGQLYYQYGQIIAPDETSAAEPWQFTLGNDVQTFAFQVYVAADVPFPDGFVQVTPSPDAVVVGGNTSLTDSVFDVLGREMSGRTVTWLSADDAIATVGPGGVVTGQAGGVLDITASSDGPEAAGSSRVTVIDASGYDVELRYMTGASAGQAQAFTNAVARWEGHIAGDISNVLVQYDLSFCQSALPVMNEVVDDLLIFVFLEEIDGVGSILGQAGPCLIRTSNDLPVVGLMRFDTADLDGLETEGLLEAVILHEMAHVMGFGTIWEDRSLLAWDNMMFPCAWTSANNEPRFLGAQAVAAFQALGGVGDTVPVEDTGGAGTKCGHWDEADFDNELMTGYINPALDGNLLSVLSIESFEDVGYAVDPSGADSYSLPGGAPATAALSRGRQLVNDVWRGPIHWIDPQGRVTPLRPGRR